MIGLEVLQVLGGEVGRREPVEQLPGVLDERGVGGLLHLHRLDEEPMRGKNPMADCLNRNKNLVKCTCTYVSCDKRGFCCECIESHKARGELPGCLFPPEAERTFDRIIRHYIEVMQDRE